MEKFTKAVEKTQLVIEAMGEQGATRLALLETIVRVKADDDTSLETITGEEMDIVVLNDASVPRNYAADMRLVILVAALRHPDVLDYINEDFLPAVNSPNNSKAEAIATTIREAGNLAGPWELTRQESGSWLLRLVCTDGLTRPVHGTLLVR